jgi:CheY-like chemotaxis protein
MTMTSNARDLQVDREPVTQRSELDVIKYQLAAIEAFNRQVAVVREAAAASARSREMRLDAARRLDVLRRQQQAVIARTHEQLEATGSILRSISERRVVLAHRQEWYLDRVSAGVRARGIHVVARTDNGADAVGMTLSEQPDLVLVEDSLTMLPGEQVMRELQALCPRTRIIAQCAYGDRVGALLDAGAAAVYTRNIPPADVADGMHRILTA